MKFLVVVLLLATALATSAAEKERRATSGQFYGAIAYHAGSRSSGWATDRKTSREARLEALKQCGHENCVVVGTVTRGCIALARSEKKLITQKGTTRQEAETKALSRCGAGCEIAAWTCTR
jgi:hypothetical protein